MSAIFGIYHRDGRTLASAELAAMMATMPYRGPDGNAIRLDGAVGCGALILRSTGEGQQNYALAGLPDGSLIAADARLDNRSELAAALGWSSHDLGACSDTELILAAYRCWGQQAPARLLGDFAFAIWDPAQREFFCARDHLGVKQLYYYYGAEIFAFATELRALLAVSGVPSRLNEAQLGDLLLGAVYDQEATLYEGVIRLPPAATISVAQAALNKSTYWSLEASSTVHFKRRQEYVEGYRNLLTAAVSCRMRGAAPLAAALSGGLDSSSIVSLAREQIGASGGAALHTFSCLHDEAPDSDEREYIAAVVRGGGIIAHYVQSADLGPLRSWEEEPWQHDEILWGPTLPAVWRRYQAVQKSGIRVMLEGLAGDIVVGTVTPFLDMLASNDQWVRLVYEAALIGLRQGSNPWPMITRRARRKVPAALSNLRRRIRGPDAGAPTGWDVPLRPDFARRSGATERRAEVNAAVTQSSMNDAQRHDLTSPHLTTLTLPLADRIAGRMGVEARYPYLDRRLVEYCLALPPELRVWRGWSRWIARAALADILPDEVARRWSKTAQNAAFLHGLYYHDRAAMEQLLVYEPGPLDGYVDRVALTERYYRFIAAPNMADGLTLWRVAVLGLWLRRFAAEV